MSNLINSIQSNIDCYDSLNKNITLKHENATRTSFSLEIF